MLSGIYAYENVNGIAEGESTYKWYRSPDAIGSTLTPIDTAWRINYTVDTLDIGKWLVFEVTPVAAKGDSAIGLPVRVFSKGSISAWDVGMGEYPGLIARVYPNPAADYINLEAKSDMDRVELINYLNQPVLVKEGIETKSIRLSVGQLPRGIYILKATTKSREWGLVRMIKY